MVASAIILPFSLVLDTPWRLAPSASSLIAVFLLGVVGTGIATMIYFRLIAGAGATFTSMINYLIPPISVVWGVVLLAETPTLRMAGALVLIIAGVGLINRKR
ncbi:MAG: DMT family transporter [Proteobacteria bacterium]|nr:DMT family transporter [Pseudomonadota bacterium]